MSTSDIPGALQLIDWLIISFYFLFVIWLGARFGKRQTSTERYFLADRKLPGWAVGMSIFATIISSWSFMGLPGKSFDSDLQYLLTVASIPLVVVIATRFLIPLFRNRIRMSAYEYLEVRFGNLARFYGDIVFIAGHFFKMSMVLYLMCLAIAGVTGWSIFALIVVVGLVTVTYTFFGGIEGVVWTDVTQGLLLLVGGILSLLYLLFGAPVGPTEVLSLAREAGKFRLVDFDFSWQQVSIVVLVVSGFNLYMTRYGTDQTVVQRYLLAPSSRQASRALWLSVGFLWFVWILFMVAGVLLWVFYELQPELLPAEVRAKPDQVLAYFIGHQLPAGVTGLILAGIFAASMSTLSSDLNSLASVLFKDFYSRMVHRINERKQLLFSRLSVLGAGLLSMLIAMALTRVQSIVDAFLTMVSVVAGGILGVFALGVLTRRCSRQGLYVGLLVGILFVSWATVTSGLPEERLAGVPRFELHIFWLGIIGNLIVFVVGYLASLVLTPGYRSDIGLTIYGRHAIPVDPD